MISLETEDEAGTREAGHDIAMALKPGDMLLLTGDLGAGKTALARSIIRHLCHDDQLEVPSPTYSICQSYAGRVPVHHLDFYRLSGPDDLEELGLPELRESGAVLIEWPEVCFKDDPEGSVKVEITHPVGATRGTNRLLRIDGSQNLLDRINRSFEIREFLNSNRLEKSDRRFLSGDASTRAYELVADGSKLLMDAPAAPDGPPLRGGKPYSRIARLAENVSAFVAIDRVLRSHGFRAPEIFAEDIDQGMLLMEYFGTEGIIDSEGKPITERYCAAVELLARLHECEFEPEVRLSGSKRYHIPPYDHDAMTAELELMLEWFLPDRDADLQEAKAFRKIWGNLLTKLGDQPASLVLRDYHSPNILWLGGNGVKEQLGLIDFQDAVMGPEAYDVASLAQDARICVSEELESALVNHYIATRRETAPGFDANQFRTGYSIMAAQRATKILGIFVRLDRRDGKPQYRKHIPRILNYIERSTRHPELSEYRNWLKRVISL